MSLRLLTFAVIATCATTLAHAGERLSGEQLKTFFTDKTVAGIHFKRGPVKTYYGPDGAVISQGADATERVGKWWVDGNKRCLRWNHKSRDFCHYVERNGNGAYTLVHSKNGKRLVEIHSTQDGNQL